MVRPSGCTVPSWNISLISSGLRRMLEPRHKRIPRTWTSVILWPAELKCCATGNPGVVLLMLRKCSPMRLLRLLPVSPMQRWEHLRQERQYTRFSEVQVKWSQMVKVLLGPRISVRGVMNWQVWHRGRWHACDPGCVCVEVPTSSANHWKWG